MTDGAASLGAFLRARRRQADPARFGLPATGRRIAGLRREEVAELAGVSLHYYIRLEQGRDRRPSPSVRGALARALGLDEQGRAHLDRLVDPEPTVRGGYSRASERARPELDALVQQWTVQAALVLGRYRDVLAANALATAINPNFVPGRNLLLEVFLDPDAKRRYPDWTTVAHEGVAALRAAVGAEVHEPDRDDLVRTLSAGSEDFRSMWASQSVREKSGGRQRFRTEPVGTVTLHYEAFAVPNADRQLLYVFFALPGSDDERLLRRLAGTGWEGRGQNEASVRSANA